MLRLVISRTSLVCVLLAMLAAGCGKTGPSPTTPLPPTPPTFLSAWGTVGSANGEFVEPFDASFDLSGNIYVADTGNHRIQKFSSGGQHLATWSIGSSFAVVDVECSDSGFVWVLTDRSLRKYSTAGDSLGSISLYHGSGPGSFYSTRRMAFGSDGDVFITDGALNKVVRLSSSGAFLTSWGTAGSDNGQFNGPEGIAVDARGAVYVADRANHRVQKFTLAGDFLTSWGGVGSADGQFKSPMAVAIGPSGNVLVADAINSRVQEFTPAGAFLLKWGEAGSGNGQFGSPSGIGVGANGRILVTDDVLNRVQLFASR